MTGLDYSFSLGKIGVLERKIIPLSILQEIVESPLEEAFSRIKDFFLVSATFKREYKHLENIFLIEQQFLKNLCLFLIKEDSLKVILQYIDEPQTLLEKNKLRKEVLNFFNFYFETLNIVNVLRIKAYSLKEDTYDYKRQEINLINLEKKFFGFFNELLRKIYYEAEELIRKECNYLLDFLVDKYFKLFFASTRMNLFGSQLVFWYYFAKRLNCRIAKFLILGKFYNLDKEKIKAVVDYA